MRIHLNRKDYPFKGCGVRRTKWLEQSESQRLETLVIVIRAYSPTTNHPFYGWFVIEKRKPLVRPGVQLSFSVESLI